LNEKFQLKITTWHIQNDLNIENVHQLPPDKLAQRTIEYIDITDFSPKSKDYLPEIDPKLFVSKKTGKGPLKNGWTKTTDTLMCCYKLVEIQFGVFGLQGKVENFIRDVRRKFQYPSNFPYLSYHFRWRETCSRNFIVNCIVYLMNGMIKQWRISVNLKKKLEPS
jgi:hypothetical protein